MGEAGQEQKPILPGLDFADDLGLRAVYQHAVLPCHFLMTITPVPSLVLEGTLGRCLLFYTNPACQQLSTNSGPQPS